MNTAIAATVVLLLLVSLFIIGYNKFPLRVFRLLGWIFERLSWLWILSPQMEHGFWQSMDRLDRRTKLQVIKGKGSKDGQAVSSAAYRASGGDPQKYHKIIDQLIDQINNLNNHLPGADDGTGQPPDGKEPIPPEEVPDKSPFCIGDCTQAARTIPVYFKHLIETDHEALGDMEWNDHQVYPRQEDFAAFFRSFKDVPDEQHRIWKLVRCGDQTERAEGLLLIADNLADCCILVAPWNQHGCAARQYCGVGEVLVARLVRESVKRNQRGAFALRVVPEAVAFYVKLGFTPIRYARETQFYTSEENANKILQKAHCHNSPPMVK